MPLRDAVRTSALSWEWRYKWVTIPDLVFDQNLKGLLNGNDDPESIVDRTLLLHKGAITKFSITDSWIKSRSAVSSWLFILSDRGINSLEFLFPCKNSLQPTIIRLVTFNHLKHLYIGNDCEVKLSPLFRGFNRLARLELVGVNIKLQVLEILLSKCPMLEYLNLKIHVDVGDDEMKELPNKLNFLTVLEIGEIDFGWVESVAVLITLIKSSPNLQSLKISSDTYYNENCVKEYLKEQRTLNVRLKCLEYVNIHVVMGYPAEMEFVKNLLKLGNALKKVEMDSPLSSTDLDVSSMLEEFASFQRASSSSKAEIIVNTRYFGF
ncbi:F-box/FBD/LRR-repeat protein At1g13570-like isoform X2 [Andrographis paniculata]|nr:F-box/FBD/LRR-repeat protein At1g13570-like isoform X2 [Andrographis paniculata]